MQRNFGFGLKAPSQSSLEHFATVIDAGIPILRLDAPLSGMTLTGSQLAWMAKELNVDHLKIECPFSADKNVSTTHWKQLAANTYVSIASVRCRR
ncbi:MAG: hypothetical protein AAGK37_19965 [Pseudomonadota bacterium]